MTPVQSSHLEAIGHDGSALFVKFRNDPAIYRHAGVPEAHKDAIIKAKSPGGYYHRAIRAARNPAVKVT